MKVATPTFQMFQFQQVQFQSDSQKSSQQKSRFNSNISIPTGSISIAFQNGGMMKL
jgi:hypothetical protein